MIKVFHKAVFFPRFLLLNLYLNELPYNLNNNAKDGEAGKNILTAGIVKSYIWGRTKTASKIHLLLLLSLRKIIIRECQ